MIRVSATDAKTRFGKYLETAQREPVIVEKSGRDKVVILSKERFDELEALEDKIWAERAKIALEEGFATEGETKAAFSL